METNSSPRIMYKNNQFYCMFSQTIYVQTYATTKRRKNFEKFRILLTTHTPYLAPAREIVCLLVERTVNTLI